MSKLDWHRPDNGHSHWTVIWGLIKHIQLICIKKPCEPKETETRPNKIRRCYKHTTQTAQPLHNLSEVIKKEVVLSVLYLFMRGHPHVLSYFAAHSRMTLIRNCQKVNFYIFSIIFLDFITFPST